MIKISDSTIERVDVGNISEAIKFAADAAGELNINIIIAIAKYSIEVFASMVNPKSMAERPSTIRDKNTC